VAESATITLVATVNAISARPAWWIALSLAVWPLIVSMLTVRHFKKNSNGPTSKNHHMVTNGLINIYNISFFFIKLHIT